MARSSTFTTYLNTQEDPRDAQVFDRLEQRATRAYSNIARAAEQATRAAAGLAGGRGTAGGGTRAIDRQASSLRNVRRAADEAATAADRNTRAVSRNGEAAARAERQQSALVRTLRTTATTLNIAQGPLGPLAGRVSALAGAVEELTGFRLGLAAVGASLFSLGGSASSFAELQGRLNTLFDSQQRANQAMDDVAAIALRTRSALEPTVELYSRLATAADSVGIAPGRLNRIVELTAKNTALSGGSAESRNASLIQFTQAFGRGELRGEELNSVLEQNLGLARAIAEGFKNADGTIGTTVGRLKTLAEQGDLTITAVLEAIERSAERTEARFARLPANLRTSFTELSNAFTVQVGRADQVLGATSAIANLVSLVARNLDNVLGLALGVGAAFAAIRAPGLVTALASMTRSAALAAQYPASLKKVSETLVSVRAQEKLASDARLASVARERAASDARVAALQREVALNQRLVDQTTARRGGTGVVMQSGQLVNAAQAQERLARSTSALNLATATQARVTRQAELAIASASATNGRYAQAVANATARSSIFRNAVSGLLGVINPYAIAIGLATVALFSLATATTAAERATATFTTEQRAAYDQIGQVTEALDRQTDAQLRLARAKQQQANTDSIVAANQARQQLGAQLSIAAEDVGGDTGRRLEELGKLARQGGDLFKIYREFDNLRQRTPALRGEGFIGGIGGAGESARLVDDAFREVRQAKFALRANIDNTNSLNAEFTRRRQPSTAPAAGGGAGGSTRPVVNTQQIGAQAIAAAVDQGADTIRAAGARRKAAIEALDDQFNVKGGRVAADKSEEYARQRTEIERTYNQEVASIKDAAKARRDAAAAGRREAQVSERNSVDDAQDRANLALIALENRKATLSAAEYRQERVRILDTLDRELNAINETGAASNRANAERLRQAREEQRLSERNGERRESILGRYSEEPRAIAKARADIAELEKLIDTVVGGAIYTRDQFARDSAGIWEGARRPLQLMTVEFARQAQIQDLILQGREREARAYERAYQLADDIGEVNEDQYQVILDAVTAEERRNLAIERRARIVSSVENATQDLRSNLEDLVVSFPERGFAVAGDFLKNMQRALLRINATRLVDRLMGNVDERVRELLSGRAAIEGRTRFFANKLSEAGNATNGMTDAARAATDALNGLANSAIGEGGPIGGAPVIDGREIAKPLTQALAPVLGASVDANGDIVVQGRQPDRANLRDPGDLALPALQRAAVSIRDLPDALDRRAQARSPSGTEVFREAGKGIGERLDQLFGSKSFFKGVGGAVGTALGGSATGAATNQLLKPLGKALGFKTSSTGAQIGGAIGSALPIPGGDIIGSIVGSLIGGAFKKTKTGSATVGGGAFGLDITGTGGNSNSRIKATSRAADSLIGSIEQIAQQLGGSIDASRGSVSIGIRDKNFRVDTSGRGNTKTKRGAIDFGDDEQAAIEFAIKDLIQDGVITGISQASQNILRAGRNLQSAVEKAALIESIPRRLMQRTDPVRYAVTELNREFEKMILALREGGATAEQFADAQKLYELERAEAIKQASNEAGDAIADFLKEMKGGSSSPLSRRTVYGNAKTELDRFTSDIMGGKVVDQNALLDAARNFQDASRELYGSSKSFFDDFNFLFDLLSKARANAGVTNVTGLPPSPFSTDVNVQNAIADANRAQVAAINDQTQTLTGELSGLRGDIRDVLSALVASRSAGGSGGGGTFGLLPISTEALR